MCLCAETTEKAGSVVALPASSKDTLQDTLIRVAEAVFFCLMHTDGRALSCLRLIGRAGLADFLEQVFLCIIEQQALVVRKVGFAPEILDEP